MKLWPTKIDSHGSEETSSRRQVLLAIILVITLACGAAICQVWTRFRVINYGYKIGEASKEQQRMKEINRRLRVELALLKSPERITRIATEELGLKPQRPEQVRRIRLASPKQATKPPVKSRSLNSLGVVR